MSWAPKTFSLERVIPLPRARLWELLSHTDHLNRAVGLPIVKFDPVADDDQTLGREATARIAGTTMRWKEFPFQWVREEIYSVRRIYHGGPIQRFEGGMELTDAEEKLSDGSPATRLRIFAELEPANFVGALLVPVVAGNSLRRTLDYCEAYITQYNAGKPNFVPAVPTVTVDLVHLNRLMRSLEAQPTDLACAGLLKQFLCERGDDEVAALRPYELANQWSAEPDAVLRLCLHATRVGLLNLSWNLMCPNCRVSKANFSSLAQLSGRFHCDLCGVAYDANFDRYVELKFAVHPSVRMATASTYCVGGPFVSPHILVQRPLENGGSATIDIPATGPELRLRVLRSNHVLGIGRSSEAIVPEQMVCRSEGWSSDTVSLGDGGAQLPVANQSGGDIVVVLEKIDWDDFAVTAARVTALQEFHDLFSSEVLAPGNHVGVESLTLFFSDLRDSTAMYERMKDAPAYHRVRRHFDYLFDQIGAHRGSVVKTIGDAVMAVFYTPEDALRASLDIQRGVVDFNATLPPGEVICIKIGIHNGPAIAINSNDRLDYFGRTVNIAARVSSTSAGDDMVMSKCCFEREGVQRILRDSRAQVDKFQCDLKGIEGFLELYRVSL